MKAGADELKRTEYAATQPEEAFEYFAREAGVTAANVTTCDMTRHPELLLAGHNLAYAVMRGEVAALPPLMTAAVEAAVEQRRRGAVFDSDTGHGLDRCQELPALLAQSPGEFWDRLAQLRRIRDTHPHEPRLYDIWQLHRKDRGAQQRTAQVLAQSHGWAGLDFPSGCLTAVGLSDAAIRYDGVPDLLADLRTYFVPSPEGTEPATTAGHRSSAANMRRLESEIAAWHASGETNDYLDDPVDPDCDPGRFGDRIIHLSRGGDGDLRLRLSDRGDAPNNAPNNVRRLQRFAAFFGTLDRVMYSGPIELRYYVGPPTENANLAVVRDGSRSNTLGSLILPLPIQQLARHLQGVTGCDDNGGKRIAEALAASAPAAAAGNVLHIGTTRVLLATDHRGGSHAETNGGPASAQPLRSGSEGLLVGLPVLRASVHLPDAAAHSGAAEALLAGATRFAVQQADENRFMFSNHPYGEFALDPTVSQRIRASLAQSEPTTTSETSPQPPPRREAGHRRHGKHRRR